MWTLRCFLQSFYVFFSFINIPHSLSNDHTKLLPFLPNSINLASLFTTSHIPVLSKSILFHFFVIHVSLARGHGGSVGRVLTSGDRSLLMPCGLCGGQTPCAWVFSGCSRFLPLSSFRMFYETFLIKKHVHASFQHVYMYS